MTRLFTFIVVSMAFAGVTACASHDAPEPSGAYRALNPGRWEPSSGDLSGGGTRSTGSSTPAALNFPDVHS